MTREFVYTRTFFNNWKEAGLNDSDFVRLEDMLIRNMRPEDLSDIIRIWNECVTAGEVLYYPLDEAYTTGVTSYGGIAASQVTLDNDEYFVMADNRSNNFDSRDSTVGAISRDDILGKVWLRVLPLDKFGRLK